MSIHREVQAAGGKVVRERQEEARRLRQEGELPAPAAGVAAPAALVTEMDAAWLRAWRRRAEGFNMHLLVAYTGKRRAWRRGKRGRLQGKRVLAYAGGCALFGAMACVELERHYRVSEVTRHLLMSDGESGYESIRAEHFPGARHQADWRHLDEKLLRAVEYDAEAVRPLRQDLYAERLEALRARLRPRARGADARAKAAAEALRYLDSQGERLYAYRRLRREPGWPADLRRLHATGAVESNVKTQINARFKRPGMGWTERGANHLVALRHLREQEPERFHALFAGP